jgi:hypothetical protein
LVWPLATTPPHIETERLSEAAHGDEHQPEQAGGEEQEKDAKTKTEQRHGEHGPTAATWGKVSFQPFHHSIQAHKRAFKDNNIVIKSGIVFFKQ